MRNNDQSPIVVSIVSLAYNHAKYIRQCLDGFIMQRTNFAFEVLIHDDASTDGTADIIREYELKYPNIIKPIYQTENQYQKGVSIGATYLYPRVQGKYIAECEGDDYWTDPLKLQKQVDFLEANPDYGLCHTKCIAYHQKQDKFLLIKNVEYPINKYLAYLLLEGNNIHTLTVMYRYNLYKTLPHLYRYQNFSMGDFPLWIEFAHHSKIKMLEDITATYRILEDSASHSKNINQMLRFIESSRDIIRFYANLYNLKLKNDGYTKQHITRALHLAYVHRNRNISFYYMKLALKYNMLSQHTIMYFVGSLSRTSNFMVRKVISTYTKYKLS